jgi:hypothetical protein
MPDKTSFSFNINEEVGRYFDDSSIHQGTAPRLVILMGGPASGKTTFRKERYSTGYVVVDAAEIFLSLSRGDFFPFPEAFEQPMDTIGELVARRAVTEKRHMVTEFIGADYAPISALIDAMQAIGYHVEVQALTCDMEEAQRRNLSRGEDNISCYYAEPYQRRWLYNAATSAHNLQAPNA